MDRLKFVFAFILFSITVISIEVDAQHMYRHRPQICRPLPPPVYVVAPLPGYYQAPPAYYPAPPVFMPPPVVYYGRPHHQRFNHPGRGHHRGWY